MFRKSPHLFRVKHSSLNRFFSSPTTLLPEDFKQLPMEAHPHKIEELKQYQKEMTRVVQKKYPDVMKSSFSPNKIVYRLCDLSPEEMIANGGFKTTNNIEVFRSGNNTGFICFSLLPKVVTVFNRNIPKANKRFIYACLLEEPFFAPGGKWRQVIVPGALPIPRVWMAKEILAEKNEEMILGPMIGHASNIKDVNFGDGFNEFSKSTLSMPEITDYGHEDQEMEFRIIDTPESQKFQEDVAGYYNTDTMSLNYNFRPF